MGQLVGVVEKPSATPGVVRFELNRSLSGMGHERFASAADAWGPSPSALLARMLFDTGKVASVHVYANIVTVELERGGKFVQCVKYACELDGLPAGETVRLPLRPMKKELKRQMLDAVITARRTIQAILAAASVFSEKGFHGATTKDIAERLGIKQGSLYYYFRSKEEALEEVCLFGIQDYVQRMDEIAGSDQPFEAKLMAVLTSHLLSYREKNEALKEDLERQAVKSSPSDRVEALLNEASVKVDALDVEPV